MSLTRKDKINLSLVVVMILLGLIGHMLGGSRDPSGYVKEQIALPKREPIPRSNYSNLCETSGTLVCKEYRKVHKND